MIEIWKDVQLSLLLVIIVRACLAAAVTWGRMCVHPLHVKQTRWKATHKHASRGTHISLSIYCMWQQSGVLYHPALLGSLRRSSMTFRITPVCRLKHSGTNDSDKGMPSHWTARSSSHPEREGQTGSNIDGEIERERDATLSRLILKFCTREPAVNHVKTHRGKKPSSVLFTRGGTIWMHGVPYRWPAGVWGRNRTRTAKKGRHISFLEGEKEGDEWWMGSAKLGKPIQCGVQVFRSTFQAEILTDTLRVFFPSISILLRWTTSSKDCN